MTIGILKESGTEKRVAMLPGEVGKLKKLGVEVIAETGAGEKAFASDEEYISAGAQTVSRKEVFSKASLFLSVNHIPDDDLKYCSEGNILCSMADPVENAEWLEKARKKNLTVLALDLIPRITRAQAMDIL
jgi:NAD(P) transhydrogenase subunit alpha